MLEGCFERVEIVDLYYSRGFGGIYRRPDVAAAGADYALVERGEGFVDGAVVAIVEDENFRALGDFAGDANGETVGVSGGERELPVAKAESALQLFADPEGIFGGKHQGDAFANAAGDDFGDNIGGMAGHGAGVAETEVDVIAIVDIGEMRAFGGFYEDGKSAGPFFHPIHGDAAEEGGLGGAIQGRGPGVVHHETALFTVAEILQVLAIDSGHVGFGGEKIIGTGRMGKAKCPRR